MSVILSAAAICLAQAVYHESRGEPIEGQKAVAQVVLNRVEHPQYPNSICGVVKATNKAGTQCAFSWHCDSRTRSPNKQSRQWLNAVEIAQEALEGDGGIHQTKALYFHSSAIGRPGFLRNSTRLGQIGNHVFYK